MLDKLARYFKIYTYIYIQGKHLHDSSVPGNFAFVERVFRIHIWRNERNFNKLRDIYTKWKSARFSIGGEGVAVQEPSPSRAPRRERKGAFHRGRGSIPLRLFARWIRWHDARSINAASNFPRESDNFKRVSLSRERIKVHGEKAFDHHFGKSKTWAVPNQSSARYYININNYDIWETMRDHTRTPRPSCIAFKKRPLHLFEILRFRASTSFWFRDLIFLHSHSVFFNDKGRTSIALT